MKDSLLSKVLLKRLERIRADLDEFLAVNEEPAIEISTEITPASSSAPVLGKIVSILDRRQEECDDGYEYDEEYCEEEEGKPEPKGLTAFRLKKAATENVITPDFLKTSSHSRQTKNSIAGINEALGRKEETFSTMLLRLIDENGLKDSEVYRRANIDRRLFSKIRGDEDYAPSKKTAISFCLALQLTLDESRELLEKAGYAFSKASRFDLIIMYLIQQEEYNIYFANIVLDEYGEGTLSK